MRVDDLFKATAASLQDTMTSHAGKAGFRIPEYQRSYSWDREKVDRLFEDMANGFYHLTRNNDESFTFLGTLILVSERNKEDTFPGSSLEIVDGQQRLTTLILIFCALIEAIDEQHHILDNLPENQREWLSEEVKFQMDALYECVIGQLPSRGQSFPFPRLVRSGDTRGREVSETEYRSVISSFLYGFGRCYEENNLSAFTFSYTGDDSSEASLIGDIYKRIKTHVSHISSPPDGKNGLGYEVITSRQIGHKGIKRLFEKLNIYGDEERDRVLSAIGKGTEADRIVRLVLVSSYMMRCVVLTRVETDDESSAFDIFDALNTTGEPLTAVETLKPRVIQYESKEGTKYKGSPSEQAFDRIREYLDDHFSNPDQRQKETKELIVSYALYVDGTKLPKSLSYQRKHLRTCFKKIEDINNKKISNIDQARRFVSGLGELAQFRWEYWNKENVGALGGWLSGPILDDVQLCVRFLWDMKTSLVIPPLARYWSEFKDKGDKAEEFRDVVRALTAFVVLRRGATGSTGRIDGELRSLMTNGALGENESLCVGLTDTNTPPSLDKFKLALQSRLGSEAIKDVNEESWVRRTSENPLAKSSTSLTRFLLLAAADQSKPDSSNPGLWSRDDVVPTDERSYLTYKSWIDDKYSTVEHIAPETEPPSGWDESIYRRQETRQTLGNLILLPQVENSKVGNAGWSMKKLFYSTFMESKPSERKKLFLEARSKGFSYTETTEKLVGTERLHFLDPLKEVDSWDEKLIHDRSENTCRLAWKRISPWLFG